MIDHIYNAIYPGFIDVIHLGHLYWKTTPVTYFCKYLSIGLIILSLFCRLMHEVIISTNDKPKLLSQVAFWVSSGILFIWFFWVDVLSI